jgi:RNA polymerase sigma-70 factor (ECF subfamily)
MQSTNSAVGVKEAAHPGARAEQAPAGAAGEATAAGSAPAEPVTVTALHEQYLDDVFRYVSRRIARREEAEDVTAEVFAAAFARLPRFRRDCPPRLWLLGIARRKVADALRKHGRRRETLASELPSAAAGMDRRTEADTPEEALQRAEALSAVHEALAALKPDQREAILLQYVEGLTIGEIAIVMGRSTGAVNSLLQRARASVFRHGSAYFLGEGEVAE